MCVVSGFCSNFSGCDGEDVGVWVGGFVGLEICDELVDLPAVGVEDELEFWVAVPLEVLAGTVLLFIPIGVGDGVEVFSGEGLAEAVDGEFCFALGLDFFVWS